MYSFFTNLKAKESCNWWVTRSILGFRHQKIWCKISPNVGSKYRGASGTISQEKMVSARFRRHSRRAAKSLRNNKLFSQGCEVGFHLEVLSSQLAAYIGQLQKEIHPTVQKGCKITSQQKGDFAALCKMLPSARSDWLAMATTSSFQLRIAHRLKN